MPSQPSQCLDDDPTSCGIAPQKKGMMILDSWRSLSLSDMAEEKTGETDEYWLVVDLPL